METAGLADELVGLNVVLAVDFTGFPDGTPDLIGLDIEFDERAKGLAVADTGLTEAATDRAIPSECLTAGLYTIRTPADLGGRSNSFVSRPRVFLKVVDPFFALFPNPPNRTIREFFAVEVLEGDSVDSLARIAEAAGDLITMVRSPSPFE